MSVENPDNSSLIINDAKTFNGEQQEPINGIKNGHIDNEINGVVNSKHKSSRDKHRDKDRSDHKSTKSSHRDKDRHSSSTRHRDKDKDREKAKENDKSDKDKNRDKDKERDKERDKNRDRSNDKPKSSSSHHKSSKDKDRDRDRHKEKSKENRDKDREHRDKDKEHRDKDKEHREKNKDHKDKENRDRDKDKDRTKEHRDKHRSSEKDKEKSKDEKKTSRDEKDRKKEHHKSSSGHDKDHEKNKDRSDNREKSDRHKFSSSKDKHSSPLKKHSSTSLPKDKRRSGDKKERHENNSFNFGNEIKKEMENQNDLNENKKQIEIENGGSENAQGQVEFKELKVELEMLDPNDYQIKKDDTFNASQSSCDYSMSQFREDEPKFLVKQEAPYDNDDTMQSMNRDPLGLNNMNYDDDADADDDNVEDISLTKRKAQVVEDSDEEDIPLIKRKKFKKEKEVKKGLKKKKRQISDEKEDDFKSLKIKKPKIEIKPHNLKNNAVSQGPSLVKGGRKKKNDEEQEEVWRWWEEEKLDDGVKWRFLEHKGPVFAPPYEPLPHNIKFYYDGKVLNLSQDAEEIACFYAKMLNHDYVTKQAFNDNFFKDWRKAMNSEEKHRIKDIKKCNFNEMHQYFLSKSEQNKSRSKDEKLKLKLENEALIAEYGFCKIDGHKERIGNFKLEPPGLFRGRGEHPKMGLVKKRLMPEDVLINCSKDSQIPQPPKGHRWREVRHDNTVTWLASWQENVQGQVKYIMLNPSSKLKGEKDYLKYETARRLDQHIDKIRGTYQSEWKSKEMRIRQRAVALYFIDKLALRAGNEKDEDQADTVGCCSLRVEHVVLHKQLNGKENVVVFDFLGKDSIRYYNEVEVEKRVYKNLELFMENKKEGDELFDRLNTSILNEHLRDLMEGLTAKVFRTYNASITLQRQLDLLTEPNSAIPEKLLAYNRANRAVAVLCNHQRSIPKSHEKSMENLKEKIRLKREAIADLEFEYNDLKRIAKRGSGKDKMNADKKLKQLERLQDQLKKLELQETDRDENKTIALGTSKLNYLDPRISVAWCKKYGVPLEKIFNKTQREKFRWAIHMADENYRF